MAEHPNVAKIKKALAGTSLPRLKELLEYSIKRHDDGADIVHKFAMDELESRLPENEFVAFCAHLDELV